jgi:hypothetical protein
MSDFINYNKRDVSLPRGCKNLIDVLQAKALRKTASGSVDHDPSKLVTTTNSYVGKLYDIGGFIDRIIHSTAVAVHLFITTPDHQCVVTVVSFRLEGMASPDFTSATVDIPPNCPYEKALRTFLVKRSLTLPDMSGPLPASFLPGIPVLPSWRIDPLPAEAPTLAVLITDLFREVRSLDESSNLHFELMEQFPPPKP